MCNVATRRMVEQLIQNKCRDGAMFTAFDISVEAKRQGIHERHRHLKNVVHQFFGRGDMGPEYQRMLIAIPGVLEKAWLYYSFEKDPCDYRPLDRSAFPARSKGPSHDGRYRVDGRWRICVPVRLLRRAGFRPGEAVVLLAALEENCLLLARNSQPVNAGPALGTYRVDRNGNIRIAQGTLRKAKLGGKCYDLDADDTRVTVRLPRT